MQKELQFTLSIIGILIIGGVLLHGMWTIRKTGKKKKKARFESRNWDPGFEQEDDISGEEPIYDDIGVGKARVVINSTKSEIEDGVENKQQLSVSIHDEILDSQLANDTSLQQNQSKNNELQLDDTDDDISQTHNGEARLDSGVSSVLEENLDAIERPIDVVDANRELQNDANRELQNEETSIDTDEVKVQAESPVYSNVVTQPKPEFAKSSSASASNDSDNSFGHPPDFLLKKVNADDNNESLVERSQNYQVSKPKLDDAEKSTSQTVSDKPKQASPDFSLNMQESGNQKRSEKLNEDSIETPERDLSFAEQAKRFVRRNKKTVAEKIRKEPTLKEKAADQMRMDFDESENVKTQESSMAGLKRDEQQLSQSETTKAKTTETDVLVLNVRASDEHPIQGASLLPMLLTLGFKFGEHDIFHRHVNTNGKGPILFSLTNMFKPGVFDIDNIENFSTYGLSLFMMLPIEGDAQQVFNMMHNAARKLSDEFDCRILDGNKVGLSKQSLQQYVERIREFERKRINK